jgi:hypothetical protein
MSVLGNAVSNLSASLKQVGGEAITYRCGNDAIELIAVPVRTRHSEYVNDDDLSLTARERDWIVWADDLVIAGDRLSPQRGDEFDWTDALGDRHTYQVLPRSDDRCYRHTDPTLQQLRVYTVEAIPNAE